MKARTHARVVELEREPAPEARRREQVRTPSGNLSAVPDASAICACSAFCATLPRVPSTASPLSLRLGRDGLRSLDEIARRRGISRSEAARQAIAETAERERRRTGLAAEAAALARHPAYVREARQVVALMEELRGSR